MKHLFIGFAIAMGVLSVVAARLTPPAADAGRTPLVWVTDDNPVRKQQVALFNRLNPDLYLKIDPANVEQQKVIVQSLGGVGPDVFDSYGSPALQSFVRSGVALDVTDDLTAAGLDVPKLLWPVGLESTILDGRVYGFPANTNANAIWFNKDLFDAEGLPYPKPGWSWDDFIRTAKRLTKRDAQGRPTRFGFYWDFNSTWDLVYQFGGRMFSPDQTRCELDSPEAIAAAQLSTDLVYRHGIAPTPVQEAALSTQGGWGTGGITYLMGGRVAMAFGGRWWLNLMRSQPDLRLGVVEIPYARKAAVIGASRVTCVNARSKNRAGAIRFLRYLAGQEYNELLNAQADALAPVRKYCYTDKYLFNPEYPQETDNAVWRQAVEHAVPIDVCPYLPGNEMSAINVQLDLMKNGVKSPTAAFRDATRDANARIQRNARVRPYLREIYVKTTGRQP